MIPLASNAGKFLGFGEKMLQTYLAGSTLENTAMIAHMREMTARLGPDVFAGQSIIERPDSRPRLPEISCPTLVLCGADDRLTPAALPPDMAGAIPDAHLVNVPDSGHLAPIENPVAVTEALSRLIIGRWTDCALIP